MIGLTMSQARLTFAPRRMPANGPLRQCRCGHGARSSFKDSCSSCSRSMCGRYRSWNLGRALASLLAASWMRSPPPSTRCSARQRLAPHIGRTRQLLADFKDDAWTIGLGEFDAIVTHRRCMSSVTRSMRRHCIGQRAPCSAARRLSRLRPLRRVTGCRMHHCT